MAEPGQILSVAAIVVFNSSLPRVHAVEIYPSTSMVHERGCTVQWHVSFAFHEKCTY
jgi:hypothetical protein